jgi:hypothetical protein
MGIQAPDWHAVVERLERVERELRWWRLGALGALVLLVGLGAGTRGATLEAERLVIRDAKGTVRAVLGTETEQRGWSPPPVLPGVPKKPAPEANFGLYIYTEEGVEVARLNLSSDGDPQLFLTDRQQQAVAWIFTHLGMAMASVSAKEMNHAEFMAEFEALQKRAEREKWSKNDKRWKEAAPSISEENLSLWADSRGYMLNGVSKLGRVSLSTGGLQVNNASPRRGPGITSPSRDGADVSPGEIHLRDASGKTRLRLALSDDGTPLLELLDKDGHSRAVLGRFLLKRTKTGAIEERPESSLVLVDRDGKVLWRIP